MSLVRFKKFLEEKDPRLKRAGVAGFNKAKRTPSHPTKSHIVVAKDGNKVTIEKKAFMKRIPSGSFLKILISIK